MEIRIGAGGWAYFQVPGLDNLLAYSKAFDFVEVNSTFYEIPEFKTVRSWRRRVPKDFEFSVRCHKSVTHHYLLEPVAEGIDNFDKMIRICDLLGSQYLHIMTPPKMRFSAEKIQSIRNFLSSANTGGVRLAWEIRSLTGELTNDVIKVMKDFDIIHCVDLSVQTPSTKSDVLYTRLFGKGHHNLYQFTDGELKEIYNRVRSSDAKKAIITFHPVKMYEDAARLKVFQRTGSFPKVTKNVGVKSLEEVLKEDAKFPTTKNELVRKQGWKVIDLTETTRVHATYYLERIQDGTYEKLEDIIKELS